MYDSAVDRLLYALLLLACAEQRGSAGDLVGIAWDSGNLYRISTVDASMTLIGNTTLTNVADIQFAPDGRLYAFTTGDSAVLCTIDPDTAAASFIGSLNVGFVAEGGLTFAPDGTAYGFEYVGPGLFRIDLVSGQATRIETINSGIHDINGLGWRSDGQLVALDNFSNSLLAIDPTTVTSTVITVLDPKVGTLGGMTLHEDKGYFSTAGPGQAGSNSLYAFEAFSGNYSLVGSFAPTISTGPGISGLAMIPERPGLFVRRATDKIAISWTTNAPGFSLETAVAVTGAPTWTPVPGKPATSGSNYVVTLPPTNAASFFRLAK